MKDDVVYLGRLKNQEGVKPVPESVRVVLKWEVPRNKQKLRKFLGFANCYREFIKDYTVIATPYSTISANQRNGHGMDPRMPTSI